MNIRPSQMNTEKFTVALFAYPFHLGKSYVWAKPEMKKGDVTMSTKNSNHLVNPSARQAMDRFKMEAASEVGVNLKDGYNGELTSRQAGSVGGQMVRKMIQAYENGMK